MFERTDGAHAQRRSSGNTECEVLHQICHAVSIQAGDKEQRLLLLLANEMQLRLAVSRQMERMRIIGLAILGFARSSVMKSSRHRM